MNNITKFRILFLKEYKKYNNRKLIKLNLFVVDRNIMRVVDFPILMLILLKYILWYYMQNIIWTSYFIFVNTFVFCTLPCQVLLDNYVGGWNLAIFFSHSIFFISVLYVFACGVTPSHQSWVTYLRTDWVFISEGGCRANYVCF